jgi:hypothetical protein
MTRLRSLSSRLDCEGLPGPEYLPAPPGDLVISGEDQHALGPRTPGGSSSHPLRATSGPPLANLFYYLKLKLKLGNFLTRRQKPS